MSGPTPALEVRGVSKAYGAVIALQDADLTVMPGESHALLGANGAGKSTLVKILSGVVKRSGGIIQVNGQGVELRRPADAFAHGIATVFQDPALIPDLTVTDNLRLMRADPATVREWLQKLDLGGLDFDVMVHEMHLATQRMLDLARVLAAQPDLLLLDEITATLPADMAERVFEVMDDHTASGRSVVFISHRLAEVLEHCDRATVLRDGEDVDVFAPSDGGEARMVQAMLGQDVQDSGRATDATAPPFGEVRLATRNLTRDDAISDVSLEVRSGEILGIAALEGQGQDGLFSLLSGERRPTSGTLEVEGQVVRARSPYDLIRKGVVLIPSDRLAALLPQRPVHENLASALYNRPRRWLPIDRADERQRVEGAIERLSIDTRARSEVRRLSGGNQQKVTIGRWLAAGFRTLLCFDPTRGIDVGTKAQIYELLHELAAEGVAIILYTSELREIPMVCDRVVVMYDGRLVGEQQAATATERSLLAAAHGLPSDEETA